VSIKSLFYKTGLLKKLQLHTPVISVGNLTFGGTGKTPVIQFILEHFVGKKLKVVVVSRNYKARVRRAARVDLTQKNAAQNFGDEPCLIATKFPMVSVYVGPQKWETAKVAELEQKPDIILIDDGFQHHALARNLDIVLLDATSEFSEYRIFPLGRARENKKSLKRAHVILLTKSNQVTSDKRKLLNDFALKNSDPTALIIELDYILNIEQKNLLPRELFGFAAIAKPLVFKNMVENDLAVKLLGFANYSDHYQYSQDDLDKISEQARNLKANALVTTEKDWVKIKDLKSKLPIFPIVLKTTIQSSSKEFYAILDKTLYSNH
jgi:tetraacyldisaccharide 4'-kinase